MASRGAHGSGAARGETDRNGGSISGSRLRTRAASRSKEAWKRAANAGCAGERSLRRRAEGANAEEVRLLLGCAPQPGLAAARLLARPPVNWSFGMSKHHSQPMLCHAVVVDGRMSSHVSTVTEAHMERRLLPIHHAAVPCSL